MKENEESYKPRRIDVHHHILPAEYTKALAAEGVGGALGLKFPAWSVEKDIELMDQTNMQGAILSLSSPGAAVGTVKTSRAIARICNDAQAKLVNDYQQRYGAFATLRDAWRCRQYHERNRICIGYA